MAKTLLVIGNGFDLSCGLKSSFKNYILSEYYKTRRDKIQKVYNWVLDKTGDSFLNSVYDIEGLKTLFDGLVFWDLYFAIPIIADLFSVDHWFDFELRIHDFIDSIGKSEGEYNTIITACRFLENGFSIGETCSYHIVLFSYLYFKLILQKTKTAISSQSVRLLETEVDKLLFSDLKIYEACFGQYIREQQTLQTDYVSRATSLIDSLLDHSNDDSISYINTFNYSDLAEVQRKTPIWHINGDYRCPIFGVDYSNIRPQNLKYKYTKTYRRLELDKAVFPLCSPENREYSKVVVYGHSLNEQDYNYFFALFNQLNFKPERTSIRGKLIEFAYAPHDGQTDEEARRGIVSRALEMFSRYNDEILKGPSFRLMDILYFSGAVKFRNVNK